MKSIVLAAPVPPPSRPPRFYVSESLADSAEGSLVRLPLTEAQHATRTLRMKECDVLEICDGRGSVALAEIAVLDKKGAMVRIAGNVSLTPREPWEWTVAVACGSLKGGRADWLVEKAAELGAAGLLPLLTERSPTIPGSEKEKSKGGKNKRSRGDDGENEDGGELAGREARWQRVAVAAMKQCLRARAMKIESPCSVAELCSRIGQVDVAWIGTEGAQPVHLAAAATTTAVAEKGQDSPKQGLLIIGPEGDFTAEEVRQVVDAGAVGVGLGPLRLRTETAAIALLSYSRLFVDSGSS